GAQLGPAYPALAPWIGALGGFLTGSNTGASAMFAASQAQAAQAIGYPVLTLVAFQNVAASLATMAAVPRVMMACRIAQDTPPPQQAIFATGVTADASVVSRSHVWPIVLVLNGLTLVVLSALSMGLM
ncbi:L-lactate permease, partial [Nitrosococcus oceani]|uniref:L-lactate permease n=1 Tax=Nitrosococcus oceani TaxID=1229 RepID=UPI0004E88D44